MIKYCFLFNVASKVIFQSGDYDVIPLLVYAGSEEMAKMLAKEYLESGKSGFLIKEVVGQYLGVSSHFLWDGETKIVSYDKMYKMY